MYKDLIHTRLLAWLLDKLMREKSTLYTRRLGSLTKTGDGQKPINLNASVHACVSNVTTRGAEKDKADRDGGSGYRNVLKRS